MLITVATPLLYGAFVPWPESLAGLLSLIIGGAIAGAALGARFPSVFEFLFCAFTELGD